MNGSARRMLRSPLVLVTGAVLLWFVFAFLVFPNLVMLREIFFPDGSFSMRAFAKLWSSDRARASLLNSFLLAAVLSVTVNVVGVFIVLATRYFALRGARLLWLGYATTLVYGGVVAVSGYTFVYGEHGFATRLLLDIFPGMDPAWFSGGPAVAVVMTLTGTSHHLLFLTSALARVDHQTVEAAQQLGASSWRILRQVVLPVLKPTLFAVTVLTFLGGLTAFAAPQVLGGRDFQTITPMILTFAGIPSSRDLAATLAVVLGVATLILLTVFNRMQAGGTYFSVSKVPSALRRQRITNPVANAVVHVLAYALFAVYLIPPLLIVVFSFTNASTIASGRITPGSFTLANYRQVLTDAASSWPFVVSIGYAAVTASVVIALMLFVARVLQKYVNPVTVAVEYLLHIPWMLPSTLTALGLVITYSVPRAMVGDTVLTGTLVLLAIAYIAAKIPITLRMLKATYAGIPDNLEEAATLLGASGPHTFRRVLLPLVLPTAAAVSALNFNSLLDDYDTSVFLAHPLYEPLGIAIQNATRSEGTSDNTALTLVYAVLLMAVSGLAMWFVYGRRADSRRTARRDRPSTAHPTSATDADAASLTRPTPTASH
ncbi:iron ABC transporter permease [Streptomyces sp. KM273126]|uniref:ABC transporter permease n=1 Tax=Streptomyces sp. KM273126 TaxID=2545247 RepID=UPI001C67ADC0|nr:iron ABC transporter permease [Streptomyces sp. KM273126]